MVLDKKDRFGIRHGIKPFSLVGGSVCWGDMLGRKQELVNRSLRAVVASLRCSYFRSLGEGFHRAHSRLVCLMQVVRGSVLFD